MGQEFFGGPEYFQEFDPEKMIRELKAQAQEKAREKAQAEEGTGTGNLDSDDVKDQNVSSNAGSE